MKRVACVALAAMLLGSWCWGAEGDELSDGQARDRLWAASLQVMGKHFLVRHAAKSRGRIVADSRISSRRGPKSRVKVESRLMRDDEGFWDVEVRVTNQIETSEPTSIGRHQPRYQWQSAGFDHDAETKLVNEIKEAAFGKAKGFPTKFMTGDSPEGKKYPPSRLVIPSERDQAKQGVRAYKPSGRPCHLLIIRVPSRRPSRKVTPLVVRGENEFREGRYDTAAATFQQALMTDPHPAVKIALGNALSAKGDYGFAAAALREGIQAVPNCAQTKMDARSFYGSPKDFEAHKKRLAKWLAEHPDDKQAKFLMGYLCYFSGDVDGARAVFAELLAANAKDPVVKPFYDRLEHAPAAKKRRATASAVVPVKAP